MLLARDPQATVVTLDQRIRNDVEGRIRSGEWRPGDRIPFEHELVGTYGCSRATVNKALTALARSGLIERRRKAGSFVAHPHVRAAVLDVPDIGAMIAARGDHYRWDLIASRQHMGPTTFSLEIMPDARGPILALSGIHHAAGEPFGMENRLIDLTTVPEAVNVEFSIIAPGSWLLGHVPWSDARHRICAIGADKGTAGQLGIAIGAPCLQIERWTWRIDRPVTFVRQTFPGDRYDLVAKFTPQGR